MDAVTGLLVEEPYFLALFDMIDIYRGEFFELCHVLYDTDFEWILELDRDRTLDGLKLRDELGAVLPSKPCSVLEVLIGLAIRMAYLVEPADDGSSDSIVADMFWVLVAKLGLTVYTNEVILRNNTSCLTIIDILNRWMQREFEPDGHGSPFPLETPVKDQRLCPMSYQMNAFVQEWL